MAAPRGNKNAAKAKVWAAAIERALERRVPADQRIKAIDELADKLLALGYEGDLSALQEIGNRLDGKPAQSLELSGNVGNKSADELPDDELANIAARGRAGTAEASSSAQEPPPVH
jgi:hypothetical protein